MKFLMKLQDYTGYLTVLILWASILSAIAVSSFDIFDMKPLSSLGVMPGANVLFSGGLLLAAITFVIFARLLYRSYSLPISFLAIAYIGQLGQIATALIPYGGEQPERLLHTISAFVLAVSIPLFLFLFAISLPDSRFQRTAKWLYRLELAAFVIGIGLFTLSIGAAYAQALPAVAFHIWILYINSKYLEMKKDLK